MGNTDSGNVDEAPKIRGQHSGKLVVVGPDNVGKTTFLETWKAGKVLNENCENTKVTIVDNFSMKYEEDSENYVTYSCWDTLGNSDYDRLRPLSYPQTDVFVFAFDLSIVETLREVEKRFLDEVEHHAPGVKRVLVGMKKDLLNDVVKKEIDSDSKTSVEEKDVASFMMKKKFDKYMSCSSNDFDSVREVIISTLRVGFGRTKECPKK